MADESFEEIFRAEQAAATAQTTDPSAKPGPKAQTSSPATDGAGSAKPSDAEPESDAEPSQPESDDLLEYIRTEFDLDLSQKYGNSEEAVRGLVEAYSKIGQRSEEASYGKALRQLVGGREAELARFLAGAQPARQEPAAGNGRAAERDLEDFPADAGAWAYQIATDADGRPVPAPGAPATVVDDYRAYQRALTKRLEAIARQWPEIASTPRQMAEQVTALHEDAARRDEQKEIDALTARLAPVMYVEGDPQKLTDFGRQVQREYERLSQAFAGSSALERYRTAVRYIQQAQPRAAPKKPGARSVRQPGVASAAGKTYQSHDEEVADRIERGEPFEVVMAEMAKRLRGGRPVG